MRPKLRIYYTSFTLGKCPFCGERGNTVMVESKTCGGYYAHTLCMDKLSEWQDKSGVLIVTLGDGQKPEDLVEINQYQIESIVKN